VTNGLALHDATTWSWTNAALSDLAVILAIADAAADASDEQQMWRAHAALVEVSESLTIAAQPIDGHRRTPEASTNRFPHERVNQLVDRLYPADFGDADDEKANRTDDRP
jgi:hypothetical protein